MKKQILISAILLFKLSCFSQAPNISYQTPQNYVVGMPITPLMPSNTGGVIPAKSYGQITTFAGSGAQGATDGEANVASFKFPNGVALDATGNVYVSESGNAKIRKITPSGVVSTLAGNGTAGSENGPGINASFSNPLGLTVDSFGNVYVSDSYNYKIRKITPSGIVSTFAGNGIQGAVDGSNDAAGFYGPNGMATDASRNVYVSEYGVMKIRKITPLGIVSTLAGDGSTGAVDGPGTAASFNTPWGMAVDAAGNLFVADASNFKIRKITPTGEVSTFAGSGAFASTDGMGTSASFYGTYGLAFDSIGNLYVSEGYSIRKITPLGMVTTICELGGAGGSQSGLAYDTTGNLYITSFSYQQILKVALTGYAITPNLPAGLSFDATTGIISGSPLVDTPETAYTISGYNNAGESSATIVIATTTLSTSTSKFSDLKLYPNPTSSILSFQHPDHQILNKIIITDLAGKKIMEQVGNSDQINVEKLAAGSYTIKVISQDGEYTHKFIKK